MINLDVLPSEGHEVAAVPNQQPSVGKSSQGQDTLSGSGRAWAAPRKRAPRPQLAFLTLLRVLVGEKRKGDAAAQTQAAEFEALTEPRRKNRNRDFQTNGW